ncbi:hypothetical protein [Gymnodinialimonas sp.]
MRGAWLAFGCCLVGATSALAQSAAITVAEMCLSQGDAAFEQSLGDGVSEADRGVLEGVFSVATFECLGLAMEICEGQGDGAACLADLATWTREARAAIVADLPEALENDAPERAEGFARALEYAAAPASEASCSEMTEAERTRYCVVVSEGLALEDAYVAWRLARQEGAVPLEGHAPVDLEILR